MQNKNPPLPEDRDKQFVYIRQQRENFAACGNPTISVDTKKKELIGNLNNPGQSWELEPIAARIMISNQTQ